MQPKKVAVLESRMGRQLVELIEGKGGIAVHAPALEELPDLAIFQTGVGTRALFAATDALGVSQKLMKLLDGMVVAVRGPKPTGALRSRGVRIDRTAADPFTTREILESIADVPLRGERVIVQRYGAVNRALDGALEAKGAQVIEIPTYKWSLPRDPAPLERLVAALGRGEIDAAVFTNAEQLRNLFLVAEKDAKAGELRAALNRTLVASIGPVASAALREAGVKVGLEAKPPKLGALLAALDQALG
jgi:uroporphyrinogen-III synthase